MRSSAGTTATATTGVAAAASVATRAADLAAAGIAPAAGSITVVPIDEVVTEPAGESAAAASEPSVDPQRAESPAARPAGALPKAGGTLRAGATRSSAAPNASAAGHPAGKREPQDDDITRAYRATQYEKVVNQCSRGPVSAEHAPWCFLAACHIGNEAKARKLITAVPAARRDQLTLNCQQLGVDIRKPDKPPEDCEADPMACQH